MCTLPIRITHMNNKSENIFLFSTPSNHQSSFQETTNSVGAGAAPPFPLATPDAAPSPPPQPAPRLLSLPSRDARRYSSPPPRPTLPLLPPATPGAILSSATSGAIAPSASVSAALSSLPRRSAPPLPSLPQRSILCSPPAIAATTSPSSMSAQPLLPPSRRS